MRLRKHRRNTTPPAPSAVTTTTRTPTSVIPLQTSRARQLSASASNSDSDVSTHKQSGSDPVASEASADAERILEERRRQTEDANKLAKAQLFLNSEVRHATVDTHAPQPAGNTAAPGDLGRVTSDTGSYLARLSAQVEAEKSAAKQRSGARAGEGDDDDVDEVDGRHHRPHGIVRRMAEKHHRKVEKREKRRRMERLRRIAALDPMKEGERQHGQAKETTFMALIRKYGGLAQEEAHHSGASPVQEDAQGVTDSTPSSETSSLDEHSAYLVDTLDVVDPGVSAAGHLSNIGNSLIFPNIPSLYDRRPVIDLPAQEVDHNAASTEAALQLEEGVHRTPLPHSSTATTAQDQDDLHLDAYVHELLTKKQKFKRAMQGVWAFLKTPIGVIAGIYGFLVVFGGAALVLFLVGAINNGKNKDYWVEVFSQLENALFTIPGVGLIPWRVRDTWRMAWIAYYQHLTWRLRKKQGLPKLADKNDIPSVGPAPGKARKKNKVPDNDDSSDDESVSTSSPQELPADAVLSPQQALQLHSLQTRFAESQSWYRPHETFTHHAFSISYALYITIFNDLNSLFQCLLCGYMWGYATHYHDRPAWSTGTFMPCSFLAGIAAAVLIWKGGEKSKKKREVEEKLLAAFARDVDKQVERMRREHELLMLQQIQQEEVQAGLRTVPETVPTVAADGALEGKTHLHLDQLAGEITADATTSTTTTVAAGDEGASSSS